MLQLTLETSALAGSVALSSAGRLLGETALSADRRNASELFPAIDALLRAHPYTPRQIELLCFSQGPGSFTGLRIAATVARMLQATTGCAVVGVPSLQVLAQGVVDEMSATPSPPQRIAAIVDARRGQVYGALYALESLNGPLRTLSAAALRTPGDWFAEISPAIMVGDGLRTHVDTAQNAGLTPLSADSGAWVPRARVCAAIGWHLAEERKLLQPTEIVPAYLRPPECEEVFEQRRAAAIAKRAGASS